VKLVDACLNVVDCEHKTAPIDEAGRYFAVGTPAMRGNRIDFEEARRISASTFAAWIRRLEPRVGDLLFAREAPVGPVVRIPESLNVAPGQRTVLLRPNPSVIDSDFLYYLLCSPAQQARLLEKAEGSTVPHLNVADVLSFELPDLPSLPEQREIAAYLALLDAKVESNRNAHAIIEQLLAAGFQRTIADEATDDVALTEIASVARGVSYRSADLQASRTALVTLKSFHRRGGYRADGLKPYVGLYKPTQVVEPGELIVAQTDLTQGAEVVGRAVRVPASESADTLVASLDVAVVRPLDGMSVEYLQGVLTDEAFREHCRSRASGTTVLHLSSDAIPSYGAPVAPADAREAFTEFAKPLVAKQDALDLEITRLESTKRALLPVLTSGRLAIPTGAPS
jgi:type I restriction enzyme S subunit